jgi:hypothetical protein
VVVAAAALASRKRLDDPIALVSSMIVRVHLMKGIVVVEVFLNHTLI